MPTVHIGRVAYVSVTDVHRATGLRRQVIRAAFARGELAGIQLGKRAKIHIKATEVARILRESRQ